MAAREGGERKRRRKGKMNHSDAVRVVRGGVLGSSTTAGGDGR